MFTSSLLNCDHPFSHNSTLLVKRFRSHSRHKILRSLLGRLYGTDDFNLSILRTSKEVQELIFRMVVENPTWGAPRIHGELLMLSFDVSERTISRWMKRAPREPEPAKRWLTFL